jgi:lipopolysaccharide biosynthesis glycosyltransferase
MSRKLWCEPIAIVTACDENYVPAAATALVSAISSVDSKQELDLFVLDGGVSAGSKSRLEQSCARLRRQVQWLTPNLDAIRGLPVSHHINHSTYLRILLAELLPARVSRAIYLDADVVVVRNLQELWQTPLENSYCAAVQDAFYPVLEPAEVFNHPLQCQVATIHDPRPIVNYRELGLSGALPYFNAGIMLVNVERWRREQVAERSVECLRANAARVRFWDQYALNVLFTGQWKQLDARWNQSSDVFHLPSWQRSHYSMAEFWQVRRDPWIVHFNNLPKPWDANCVHPFRDLFFQHLERTPWARSWPQQPHTGLSKAA